MTSGEYIYEIAERIFPICRSITGNGVRETLRIIREYVPELEIVEVPSGTQVFDWTVPKEWNIKDAYIENQDGERIIDFKNNNLHVLGYSYPLNKYMSLSELKEIVYTQKEQPDVIPYVTSYYKERSGFCMSENQLNSLKEGQYHAVIDSEFKDGSLTYAEVVLPGESKKEIFFSTYICHPSMANNECSGPALQTALINHVRSIKNRHFTYRFVFVPETIGSITYLSQKYKVLKENVYAGFLLSCVGDDRDYSIVSSRYGETVADQVLKHILEKHTTSFKVYSYLERGSDERQYNAPGIDLPVCGFCRTKYAQYPEYHTSADDLSVISPNGFAGSYDIMTKCIELLEYNRKYKVKVLCEPQLGKRGLYPTISQKGIYDEVRNMTNFIAYADGRNTLVDIAQIINADALELIDIAKKMCENGLMDYE